MIQARLICCTLAKAAAGLRVFPFSERSALCEMTAIMQIEGCFVSVDGGSVPGRMRQKNELPALNWSFCLRQNVNIDALAHAFKAARALNNLFLSALVKYLFRIMEHGFILFLW